MDLGTVTSYRRARTRAELVLAPGERLLGGGTWLFSEPQPEVTGLVDLSTMPWAPAEVAADGGLRLAGTCTIAELVALEPRAEWAAQPLFRQCADSLLASFKVWESATVGGNIARAFAAGAMVSLGATLDAEALIWHADGTDSRRPVAAIPIGNGRSSLVDGDVIRAVDIPAHALRARTAHRKIALAEHGRSGAVLTGRADADGRSVFVITAATLAPVVLRYDELPSADRLRTDAQVAPGYYSDPLGSADWRRAVSVLLLEQVRAELAAAA